MKVLQVVTLASQRGTYGGPVAVAVGQSAALARRGHQVHLVAGWDGAATVEADGVAVTLARARQIIPGAGFSGLASPGASRAVQHLSRRADIVHLHLARDLIMMPAASLVHPTNGALVVQGHGMLRQDARLRARLMDWVFTRRILRRTSLQLTLTSEEEADTSAVAGFEIPTARLANGVPAAASTASWKDRPEVLYCARLHARKRPIDFVHMAVELVRRGLDAHFTMIGPDGGELARVRDVLGSSGLGHRFRYEGALPPAQVVARMAQAQIYVLPSGDDQFPLSVLEAMSVGLPCVITTGTGLSEVFAASGSVAVVSPGPRALADGVESVLASPAGWSMASRRARSEVTENYSVDAVARDLERLYLGVTGRG